MSRSFARAERLSPEHAERVGGNDFAVVRKLLDSAVSMAVRLGFDCAKAGLKLGDTAAFLSYAVDDGTPVGSLGVKLLTREGKK